MHTWKNICNLYQFTIVLWCTLPKSEQLTQKDEIVIRIKCHMLQCSGAYDESERWNKYYHKCATDMADAYSVFHWC